LPDLNDLIACYQEPIVRFTVIQQEVDLSSLVKRISKGRAELSSQSTTLDLIKRLNPTIDLNQLKVGTVVLLPDSPDLNEEESSSFAAAGLLDQKGQLVDGIGQIITRIETFGTKYTEVHGLVNTAKSNLESSPLVIHATIKSQIQQMDEQFKSDSNERQDVKNVLEKMQAAVGVELDSFIKLLK
jgi:hypothetical protein